MDNKLLSILVVLLACQYLSCANLKTYLVHRSVKSGTCNFRGYIPGGNKVITKRVLAPEAKIQKASLSMLSLGDPKVEEYKDKVTDYMNGIVAIAGDFSGQLGLGLAVLGLFTMIENDISEKKKPSLEDAIAETNKAFKQMTVDVNNRLDQLEGYVDHKVLQLEKRIMNQNFRALYQTWINCKDEATDASKQSCLVSAIRKIRGDRGYFFANENFENTWSESNRPPVDEVKRMEANILAFRDYVELNLLALETMKNIYKGKKDKQATYNQYSDWLKTDVEKAVKYANFAYRWSLDLHSKRSEKTCEETLKCEIKDGGEAMIGDCSCRYEATLRESERCSIVISILKKGPQKEKYSRKQMYAQTIQDAIKQYGKESLTWASKNQRDTSGIFVHNMKQTVEKFWQNELMDLVPTWKDIIATPTASKPSGSSVSSGGNVGSRVLGALSKYGDTLRSQENFEYYRTYDDNPRESNDNQYQDRNFAETPLDNYERPNFDRQDDFYKPSLINRDLYYRRDFNRQNDYNEPNFIREPRYDRHNSYNNYNRMSLNKDNYDGPF